MIIVRSTNARWLSHSWLVAAAPEGPALVVDAGAPAAPLLRHADQLGLRVELVILTHHHGDHVCERGAFSPVPCAMHPLDAEHVPDIGRLVADGEHLRSGALDITLLHVPGHTRGQINVLARAAGHPAHLFSGDTLFRGSVGGTRAPGHGTFAQLRSSIEGILLGLPDDTIVHPGHGEDTTIGRERAGNPFLRAWRGDDATLDEPCTALGQRATLLTWTRDYDDGFKAWVRWSDGTEDTVPGSRVERGA